jgi:protein-disulfide isomerase
MKARYALLLILCLTVTGALPMQAQDDRRPVARIGTHSITPGELETFIGNRMVQLRTQEYAMTRRALDELIAEYLVREESKRLGITINELGEKLRAGTREVTDQEVRLVYEASRERYGSLAEQDAVAAIRNSMTETRVAARRRELLEELRRKADVRILLQPPRIAITERAGPSRGRADAPVTLVQFSDYQCSYCAKMVPVIKQLEAQFPNEVRIVTRDFPLRNHTEAPAAAEAAHCAGEQGKFWEMHERLFENQSRLTRSLYVRLARDLRLDEEKFGTCLVSERQAFNWRDGERDGKLYGITGTPSFFVNGRLFSGVVPLEALVEAIKDELNIAGSRQ